MNSRLVEPAVALTAIGMKAALRTKHGGPEEHELGEAPNLKAGTGQVVVDADAAKSIDALL